MEAAVIIKEAKLPIIVDQLAVPIAPISLISVTTTRIIAANVAK